MPFIRLSDNYIDNPKIVALSEGSFCLWHEGMAYARKHQTDGIITFNAMKAFRFYTKGREKQLSTPYTDGANPLWALIPATGYKIHDYLDWNLSREEEQSERSATAARVRRFRDKRNAVTSSVTEQLRNGDVPDRTGIGSGSFPEKGFGEKPTRVLTAEDLGDRARELLENYVEWYRQERKQARLSYVFNEQQFTWAVALCRTWDDARLEKLARLVLSTDDPFISGTDRSFRIFQMKASWADDRLRQWETANGVAV